MQKHRKMGVDYGDKRIGIALTDSLCIISSPFEVYKNVGEEDALKHLDKIIKDYDVDPLECPKCGTLMKWQHRIC